MKTLQPVEVSEYYIDRIASGMRKYFWKNIFIHIFGILEDNTVFNSKEDLLQAIKKGIVYYEKGAFRGKFNNRVSKTLEDIGARFRNGAFYIERSAVPIEYINAISIAQAQSAMKISAISDFLLNYDSKVSLKDFIGAAVEGMYKKLSIDLYKSAKDKNVPVIELGYVVPEVKLPRAESKSIEKYWKDYETTVQKIKKEGQKAGMLKADIDKKVTEASQKAFENAPNLNIDVVELDKETQKIVEDYVYNMEYWVKNWEVKNIVKMRQEVLKMVQDGARTPTIKEYFASRWKVAKDKAYFLAVNESNLASSVIKATHYQNMGFTHFRWGRSVSKEKRLLHEEYYDKVFSYSDPPIIDTRLGIKGLPRQIWNCKCMQIPIVNQSFFEQSTRIHNAKRNIFKKIINGKQLNNNTWRYRRFGEG